MPPKTDEVVPNFEGVLCDGEVFEDKELDEVIGERGAVLYFHGFVFSAIARHWWKRFDRNDWDQFDGVPVIGIGRDGPFAQNAFIRKVDSPFQVFSDVDGCITDEFDLRMERDGMSHVTTPRRSVFVLNQDREVSFRWLAKYTTSPPPVDEIEDAVAEL